MRIFTVERVSEGFLGSKLMSVRTRSCRSRIVDAVVIAGVFAALSLPQLAWSQAEADSGASAQQGVPGEILCQPQVVNWRRVPKESVLARMSSHQGDPYDPAAVERDFNSLWNTGYYENVRIERADTGSCVQLVVYVREKPTIRTIEYVGLNAVSVSDVDERLKKAKVGLLPESQYDATRVKRAEDVLKDLLAEHGHQFATIKTELKTIPPNAMGITFRIK